MVTDLRKRFKSDSCLQKSSRTPSKKSLEDHVFYALENFFSMDTGKLIPKVIRKGGELTESLIPNTKEDVDETSFMSISSLDGVNNRTHFHPSRDFDSYVVKTDETHVTDNETLAANAESNAKTTNKESKVTEGKRKLHVSASAVLHRKFGHQRTSSEKGILNDEIALQRVGFHTSKFAHMNMSMSTGDISKSTSDMFQGIVKRMVKKPDSIEVVSADVHTEQTQTGIKAGIQHLVEPPSAVSNDSSVSLYHDSRSQASVIVGDLGDGTQKDIQPNDQSAWKANGMVQTMHAGEHFLKPMDITREASIKRGLEAKPGMVKATVTVQVEDDSSVRAQCTVIDESGSVETKNALLISNGNGNREESVHCAQGCGLSVNTDQIVKETSGGQASCNAVEDEGPTAMEMDVNTEVLPFREHYRKYLSKPYKDLVSLTVCYIICVIPQIVLDIYRIATLSYGVKCMLDGVMSVISDVSMALFLLVLSLVFLWRFQTRREMARNKIDRSTKSRSIS